MEKSSVAEIRERFDQDVDRFSNLETGQLSTIDATLSLELITEAAKRIQPLATQLLDIGCGAGNYTVKMLSKLPALNCTLIDLSKPMLEKAQERVSSLTEGEVNTIQGDIREVEFPKGHYDIILAGAVLHHLRNDADWEKVFHKLFNSLKPGGCLMIADLVIQESEVLTSFIWEKFGDYLEKTGGSAYRDKVLAYVEKEDSPRSVNYQLALMKKLGFTQIEILHKNLCFSAFGGVK